MEEEGWGSEGQAELEGSAKSTERHNSKLSHVHNLKLAN